MTYVHACTYNKPTTHRTHGTINSLRHAALWAYLIFHAHKFSSFLVVNDQRFTLNINTDWYFTRIFTANNWSLMKSLAFSLAQWLYIYTHFQGLFQKKSSARHGCIGALSNVCKCLLSTSRVVFSKGQNKRAESQVPFVLCIIHLFISRKDTSIWVWGGWGI